MKQIALILLVLILAACTSSASKYRSAEEVMEEARQVATEKGWTKIDGQPLDTIVVTIPNRRLRGEQLIALGEWVNAERLAEVLLELKDNPDSKVLVYFANPSAQKDYLIIAKALVGLRPEGVKFILAARSGYKARFEELVKPSGMDFMFIDTLNKRF